MNIVALVQVRMSSSRLPGKALSKILGKPILWHIVNRLKASELLSKIAIATSVNPQDRTIVDFAKGNAIDCYTGSEDDLVDRLYQAAVMFRADVIVRITADCPLADPAVVDRVIKCYLDGQGRFDYVSNVHPPTYPDGLDTEVFSVTALKNVWQEVTDPFWREWAMGNFYDHPEKYRLGNVAYHKDLSSMRWTVDYQEDLDFVTEIYRKLYQPDRIFLMEDVLKLLEENPQIMEINAGYTRNNAYLKSLKSRGKKL